MANNNEKSFVIIGFYYEKSPNVRNTCIFYTRENVDVIDEITTPSFFFLLFSVMKNYSWYTLADGHKNLFYT